LSSAEEVRGDMSTLQEQFHSQQRTTYISDERSSAEIARLIHQDQLMTTGMGGLLPEIDLGEVQRVVDLACGPGGWALEMAYTYSDMEIVGVDISERMIAYAKTQAQVQQRTNVSFQVMDILKPLDFPDHSFDMINARLISGFMRREKWPLFFQECLRILRPGGILRLTENEGPICNSPHFEKALHMGVHQAMNRIGMGFSPNSLYYGIVHMLPYFFRQAGLSLPRKRAHMIDFSFGTEAHQSFAQNAAMLLPLLEPLVAKTQLATPQEWRNLTQKAVTELYEEDFCGVLIMVTVWAEKPL
jgi:ubiquinone/menaquinone biosynthesis C-methylase UbiE